MAWIKRNLIFVLGMATGLILTVYCAVLFAGDFKLNAGLNHDFEINEQKYNQLTKKSPYPSEENITRAKEDRMKLEAVREALRVEFTPFPTPPKEDEKGFSTYLEDTIAELQAKAAENTVALPTNMSFGFTDLRGKLKFDTNNIPRWMQQLTEIKALCDILFSAKINSLAGLRRVPVATNDAFLTPADLLSEKIKTTTNGTFTPYRIEFRGFSRELADVLTGLATSSNFYAIDDIQVAPAGQRQGEQILGWIETPDSAPPSPNGRGPRAGGTNTPPARSGGATNRPTVPTPPTPTVPGRGGRSRPAGGAMVPLEPAGPILVAATVPPTPAARGRGAAPTTPERSRRPTTTTGPVTVLREQLLLITISVEVIRLN
jgi:hypothetical protein